MADSASLTQVFQDFSVQILSSYSLPYNPYPGYVKRFRAKAHELSLKQADPRLTQLVNQRCKELGGTGLFATTDQPRIYGLQPIISNINLQSINVCFRWMEELRPLEEALASAEGLYDFDVALALVGTYMYKDVIYLDPARIDFRIHFLAYSTNTTNNDKLVKLTAKFIVDHLVYMDSLQKHLVMGASVVALIEGRLMPQLWSLEKILKEPEEFLAITSLCISQHEKIYAELYLTSEKGPPQRARVLYALTHVNQKASVPATPSAEGRDQIRSVDDYTLSPLQTLHEGAFLTKSDIESYISAYLNSSPIEESQESEEMFVSVNDWRVTSAAHASWINSVGVVHPDIQFYDIVQKVLLAVQFEIGVNESGTRKAVLLKDICSVLASKSAAVNGLLQTNKHIRELAEILLMQGVPNRSTVQLIRLIFREYYEHVSSYVSKCFNLCGTKEDQPSLWAEQIKVYLSEISLDISGKDWAAVKHKMKRLNFFLVPHSLELTEDVLFSTESLRKYLNYLYTLGNVVSPNLVQPHLEEQQVVIFYGFEREEKLIARTSTIPINDGANHSQSLVSYVVDNHLYEVWDDILHSLIDRDASNPFHVAITAFRRAAIKMEMLHLSSADIRKILTQVNLLKVIFNADLFVYRLNVLEIFGSRTALSYLNGDIIEHSFALIKPLAHLKMNQTFYCNQALSGLSPLFGSVISYLTHLQVSDYWYHYGNIADSDRIIKSFVVKFMEYLTQLKNGSETYVYEVKVGELSYSLPQMLADGSSFTTELSVALTAKKHIIMTIYIVEDWRYLRIEKSFYFSIINDTNGQVYRLSPKNPVDRYQCVFDNSQSATEFAGYQYTSDPRDPYSTDVLSSVLAITERRAVESYKELDYLQAMGHILTKTVLTQATTHLSEAFNYFSSLAAELHFAYCICDDLSKVIEYKLVMDAAGFKTSLQQNILHEHFAYFQLYIRKLSDSSQVPTLMSSTHLWSALQPRLSSCLERVGDKNSVKVCDHTMEMLRDLSNIIKGLLAIVQQDVFLALCPSSLKTIRSALDF